MLIVQEKMKLVSSRKVTNAFSKMNDIAGTGTNCTHREEL